MKDTKYKWVMDPRELPREVTHPNGLYDFRADKLLSVGILADGSLHNPNGYPEEVVRQAVEAAIQRGVERRSAIAKKAAATKARRREKKIIEIARRVLDRHGIGPSRTCDLCRKTLSDQESIDRGIGPECWQDVLKDIERQRDERVAR